MTPPPLKGLIVEVYIEELFLYPCESPISLNTWQGWFTTWLGVLDIPGHEGEDLELTLRLIDDRAIQLLNQQYRGYNQPTDVLAFAALENDFPQQPQQPTEPLYLGDLVISIETAQRQAQQQGHSLQRELAWLATHGLLHLVGWDHPDQTHLDRMLKQQDFLIHLVGA